MELLMKRTQAVTVPVCICPPLLSCPPQPALPGLSRSLYPASASAFSS